MPVLIDGRCFWSDCQSWTVAFVPLIHTRIDLGPSNLSYGTYILQLMSSLMGSCVVCWEFILSTLECKSYGSCLLVYPGQRQQLRSYEPILTWLVEQMDEEPKHKCFTWLSLLTNFYSLRKTIFTNIFSLLFVMTRNNLKTPHEMLLYRRPGWIKWN